MSIIDAIREKAAKDPKRIVLPESDDPRTLEALNFILDKKMAKIILIAEEGIRGKIKSSNLKDLELIDPKKYEGIGRVASEYYELRRHKGVTPEEARNTVLTDYVTFGAMLVRQDVGHAFVAGASHTTAETVRAALRCLKIDKAISVVSGAFLMEVHDSPYGENGVFVFADCGVNPQPDARQLSGIAISSAQLFKKLVGKTPRVAFLSYSSKGSASGPLVDKVREAVARAREISPDLLVDGELQVDTALDAEVAGIKFEAGDVAGRANVLIFPDLNSGNISYKMVQRLANARAVGPILLGFQTPASDLSRGCSSEDIVDAVAVTSII